MASGVPVVATPVSGIPELIEAEREGLLVPQGSPARLADALERLLTEPELRGRLARAALAKVEACFSIEGGSTRLLALFQRNGR
jgi:glycosyltransferase involved in cell wall biosynthesis